MPTHLGLILDGNRRYAKEMGLSDVTDGHREGARRLDDVLQWCADLKIKIVTVWVLSPENVNRDRGRGGRPLSGNQGQDGGPCQQPRDPRRTSSG